MKCLDWKDRQGHEGCGNIANVIEMGNRFIPCRNHRYTHMKVEVESFDTDIIEYDNHH